MVSVALRLTSEIKQIRPMVKCHSAQQCDNIMLYAGPKDSWRPSHSDPLRRETAAVTELIIGKGRQ
ncbi:hypothetical protein LOAG_12126 [Loa loa]|uniref:Uncharacterized protein n=1 Tax=Loa loa TaxID=7209 RepID=A0A1S0TLV7_LOALO|nr:hypothetical protein LOAG_12126 [Loa loa]EFO16383.1 hypothetical protein LOAG_12126 [Loa loa]